MCTALVDLTFPFPPWVSTGWSPRILPDSALGLALPKFSSTSQKPHSLFLHIRVFYSLFSNSIVVFSWDSFHSQQELHMPLKLAEGLAWRVSPGARVGDEHTLAAAVMARSQERRLLSTCFESWHLPFKMPLFSQICHIVRCSVINWHYPQKCEDAFLNYKSPLKFLKIQLCILWFDSQSAPVNLEFTLTRAKINWSNRFIATQKATRPNNWQNPAVTTGNYKAIVNI